MSVHEEKEGRKLHDRMFFRGREKQMKTDRPI